MKIKPITDHKTEVAQAWSECGRCSDAYYHEMTNWLTSYYTKASAKIVYDAAMIYESALRKYLDCLKTLPVSIEIEHNVAKAFAYRSYLTRDIELLLPMIGKKRKVVFRQIPDLVTA